MARDVVRNHLEVPLPEGTLQGFGQIWAHGPWGPECRSPWRWFPFPPCYGAVDCLKGESPIGFLNICC